MHPSCRASIKRFNFPLLHLQEKTTNAKSDKNISQQRTLTMRIMGHYGTLLEHYGPLEHNFELFWALVAKVVIFLEGC